MGGGDSARSTRRAARMQRDQGIHGLVVPRENDVHFGHAGQEPLPARRGVPVAVVRRARAGETRVTRGGASAAS
jgi:hypothetical protein